MTPDRPILAASRQEGPSGRGSARLALAVFAVCYLLACAVTLMPRGSFTATGIPPLAARALP